MDLVRGFNNRVELVDQPQQLSTFQGGVIPRLVLILRPSQILVKGAGLVEDGNLLFKLIIHPIQLLVLVIRGVPMRLGEIKQG